MIDAQYITLEDLTEISPISQNCDPVTIVPFIRSSEAMFIIPVLGTALDTELKQAITGNTLTNLQKDLIQNYIKPASAWASFSASIVFQAFKITPKGVNRKLSDNSELPSVEELNYFKQSAKDLQVFYIGQLEKYLNENETLFPSYRSNCNTSSRSNSNGIYLGKFS